MLSIIVVIVYLNHFNFTSHNNNHYYNNNNNNINKTINSMLKLSQKFTVLIKENIIISIGIFACI